MSEPIFESITTMDQREFAAWIDTRPSHDTNRYELLGGRVVMNPPAGWPHGRVENRIAYRITAHVESHGGGQVFGSSQGFDLPTGDTLEPDATFVSDARIAAAPPPVHGKFLQVVPDLVVEILSRSTARRDRGEKKAAYAEAGVREYWIVDTRARTVAVFAAQGSAFDDGRVIDEHGTLTSRVLPGLSIAVCDLF